MGNKKFSFVFLAHITFFSTICLLGQDVVTPGQDVEVVGEVEDAEIVVEKDRKIVLPKATRNFYQADKTLKKIEKTKVNHELKEFELQPKPIMVEVEFEEYELPEKDKRCVS